ncbi:hypothetical protein MIND_00942800 [Mycena indigotica]|uniref:Uncharacterized protein n=1 Tax=Mycena indigotica TaxID=2126181 RepID=A0A8H6W2M1_9AGAR|nr:uncharacterized protein MIND_00942800 [Mycena indigotica]KAF7297099.1 hypothetical protein MIND_00942800 [Mycena indigotica]
MPSRTTSGSSSSKGKLRRRAAVASRPAFPEDLDTDADENNSSFGPVHLDEPRAYTFKPNERVWIRNHDKWIAGRIFPSSVPKIRSSDNLVYWDVKYSDSYGHKLRRCFAPLLGDLKPDNARVRRLLREAHWIYPTPYSSGKMAC